MAWWNHLVNWGPPSVIKTLNPPPTTPRPPPPRPQLAPLLLTKRMELRPTAAQWKNANKLFDHPRGCRCSTCRLVAELAVMILDHDARAVAHDSYAVSVATAQGGTAKSTRGRL